MCTRADVSSSGAALVEHSCAMLRDMIERLSFCLKISPPSWKVAERWGDLHFARALGRALACRGHTYHVQVREEWDNPAGLDFDVALQLRGRAPYTAQPGQLNVMWLVSHPNDVSRAELERCDLVLVASPSHASTLTNLGLVSVTVLEQATDPALFHPEPDPDLAHELAFVGNSRNVRRKIISDVLPTDRDLAIWGSGWKGIVDRRHLVGRYFPNERLRQVYSSAGLVLCDHWDDMREHGFVSNRIYDALACGAVVVSDRVPGIERFVDAVATYDGRDELHALIDLLLADRDALRERGERGREIVLHEHTFSHRVEALLQAIAPLVASR